MNSTLREPYRRLAPPAPEDPINGPLVWATIKYLLWLVATKLILGALYFFLVSEGLRRLVPPLGQKLRTLPGLGWVADYEALYKLDLAHVFALGLLLVTFQLWISLLRMWLRIEGASVWDNQIVALAGLVIVTADAILFHTSISQWSWTGSESSSINWLMTAMYVAFLMYSSYVSLKLKQNLEQEKRR